MKWLERLRLSRNANKNVKGIKLFIGYIGLFLILNGIIILCPLFLLIFYPNEWKEYYLFLGPGVTCIVVGSILYFIFIFKKNKARLEKWQSYLLLISVWLISIFCASLPFMITDQFNFTQAIFEATSGYTSTSITLLDEIALENCSHLFIFYRVWLIFIGGIGLTLILTSAISDSSGLNIYNLEGHNDRLLPNLIKSSRIIFLIYFIYIVLGVIAYVICKMNLFDAICNAISSVSTGGLMNVVGGIGAYNSIPIEIVTIVLMLLGSTNFMIHYALIRGKFKTFFYHSELFCFLIMFVIFIPPLIVGFTQFYNGDFLTGLRHAIFNFVSTTTSSGFILGKGDFSTLSPYMYISILFLMIVGGQAGSTSGGIKQIRLVQIVKQINWQISGLISSPHVVPSHTIIQYGKKETVDKSEFTFSSVYLCIYIATILLGTFAFCCFGYNFENSLFEITSLITTTGFSAGIVVPTSSMGVLWIAIITMFIGRLDPIIFVMLISKGGKSLNDKINYKMIEKQLNN